MSYLPNHRPYFGHRSAARHSVWRCFSNSLSWPIKVQILMRYRINFRLGNWSEGKPAQSCSLEPRTGIRARPEETCNVTHAYNLWSPLHIILPFGCMSFKAIITAWVVFHCPFSTQVHPQSALYGPSSRVSRNTRVYSDHRAVQRQLQKQQHC